MALTRRQKEVLDYLQHFAPSPACLPTRDTDGQAIEPDPGGALFGTVFYVHSDPHLGKVCLARIHRGTLAAAAQVHGPDNDKGEKLGGLFRLVGKKRAKEMRYCNPRISAREALEMGLINRVVPDDQLARKTREFALEVAERGAFALASIKGAFNARHGGVGGLARVAHDLLLRQYLDTDESKELSTAFAEKRKPDATKFGR